MLDFSVILLSILPFSLSSMMASLKTSSVPSLSTTGCLIALGLPTGLPTGLGGRPTGLFVGLGGLPTGLLPTDLSRGVPSGIDLAMGLPIGLPRGAPVPAINQD